VEVAQRYTEAFLKNLHGKNMAFEKHRGVVIAPGSSRVKTWLRSTMAEASLTGLALLASCTDCTDITVTHDAVLGIFFCTSRT